MKALYVTLGLGGLTAWLLMQKAATSSEAGELVKKNGHEWLIRPVKQPAGAVGANVYSVYAPAGSWGPHAELLVVRYSVATAPNAKKILAGVGAGVPIAMRDAALTDLGIAAPS